MSIDRLFIVSGPSGSGQDTIIEKLASRLRTERIVTTTTRSMRPGESEGHPYYFVSKETFRRMIDREEFTEWAEEYNDQLYGTTTAELERVATSGHIGIWKIEWQGVVSAKRIFPEIISILVTASPESLEARIRRRDNPDEAYLRERMRYTMEWFEHTDIYDYTVENRDGELETAVAEVERIIRKHSGFRDDA